MSALLAQITDVHLSVGPGDAGTADALAAAVDALGRLDPAPQAVLLTGDLTETGDPRAYFRLRELLAPLTVPVHPIPGNHDDRDALRAAFGDHPGVAGAGAHVQYEARCGPLRILLCDTLDPGHGGGRLDDARLAWLEERLAGEPDAPTLLALHHPPILTGMQAFDEIGLPATDRARLAALLARAPGIRGVAAGHVHREITGRLGACPVVVCPSAWRQARLDLRPGAPIALGGDPPGYALHLLGADGALVTHAARLPSG